ncbi:MAG: hypothetical protein WCP35_17975 [Verrucomicrobiota bacterium]
MFKLFRRPKHDEHAKLLLQRAQIIAASSTLPILNAYPALSAIFRRPEFCAHGHWDFFVTAAGLGTGLSLYAAQHPPSDMRLFASALILHIDSWDGQAATAVADFQEFVTCNMNSGAEHTAAIGSWIVWNIKGSPPLDPELVASPAIGALVLNGVRDWMT